MNVKDVAALLELPFPELIYRAQSVHRSHHDPAALQLSTLLSVKTGGCPEDCAYCPQSRRYRTGVEDEDVLSLETVTRAARAARSHGASRFCMGAAWRGPKERELEQILPMVRQVKDLGLETCATLGMLKPGQAERLRDAGLDYYNHNLDTSPEFYGQIITTREYRDRLETLQRVRDAGLRVCCGGIVGMGESRHDRAGLISTAYYKDPTDAHWANDPAMKQWQAFMKKYYPDGSLINAFSVYGYTVAATLHEVLRKCGDNLTRENVMRQAASMKGWRVDTLLPGITITTSQDDFAPIQSVQLQRFNGKQWELFGEVISSN